LFIFLNLIWFQQGMIGTPSVDEWLDTSLPWNTFTNRPAKSIYNVISLHELCNQGANLLGQMLVFNPAAVTPCCTFATMDPSLYVAYFFIWFNLSYLSFFSCRYHHTSLLHIIRKWATLHFFCFLFHNVFHFKKLL
jgi:hypothetical protein